MCGCCCVFLVYVFVVGALVSCGVGVGLRVWRGDYLGGVCVFGVVGWGWVWCGGPVFDFGCVMVGRYVVFRVCCG